MRVTSVWILCIDAIRRGPLHSVRNGCPTMKRPVDNVSAAKRSLAR